MQGLTNFKRDPDANRGFVLANGSMLLGQLFSGTQISVCLWFFWKNDPAHKSRAVSEFELALAA